MSERESTVQPTSDAPLDLRLGPFRVRTTTRGVVLFVGFVLAGGAGYAGLAQTAGLATAQQVEEVSRKATAEVATTTEKVTVLETTISEHSKALEMMAGAQAEMRDAQFEDRAERLADRAADRVRDARKSREVWQRVRARAVENQQRRAPIRDGVEALVE